MNIIISIFKYRRVGFGILICLFLAQGALGQKKNLLFIMTDQQRYDALSLSGNTVLQTPNLDRLAQQGVYFKNAYTPCSVCCPARSSILTGCTVENTGMRTNDAYYNVDQSLMPQPTFDEILTDEGYRCEYYGKWHSSSKHTDIYQNPDRITSNGKSVFGSGGQTWIYRDYLATLGQIPEPGEGEFVEGLSKYPYIANPLDRYFGISYQDLKDQNKSHSQPDQHGELQMDQEHTFTAFQARQTIEAIERLKDEPFSITCSFHFPHSPMLPPEPYYGMYPVENMVAPASISDNMENSPYKSSSGRLSRTEYADPDKIKYMISDYYGLIKEIDDWVGKILDKVDELGLTENTLIIFTSDHGEMMGSHGMREKNVFYEESAHIPLLMRFPNEIADETKVEAYVSLVDLFPTILDYLGVEEHDSDGKSLRGLIEGTDKEHGKYVVTERDFRGDSEPNYMIIKDGWKLIIPYTISSSVINAMYDLNTDPLEMKNLLGSNPDKSQHLTKAEELRGYLLEWLAKNNSIHYYSVKKRNLLEGGMPTGNNATFVSQVLPPMLPGETVSVSVTMKNTGTTAWTQEGNFKLGSQSPADNSIWGLDRINLSAEDSITPNAEKIFTFDITVPAFDGNYNFQWQMIQVGEEWFGGKSDNEPLTIGDPGNYLDDCDNKTGWKDASRITLNTTDQLQGSACLEYTGSSSTEFKKAFSTPYNSGLTVANGVLQFWYYVSDPSLMGTSNQVELGSAGVNDKDEFNWKLRDLTKGWNFLSLNISDAGTMGTPDLSAINWFRIYDKKSGTLTTRVDAIQLIDPNAVNIPSTVNHSVDDGNSNIQSVNIYPNPLNQDILHIDVTSFNDMNTVDVTITNLLGQRVYSSTIWENQQHTIDTNKLLEAGVYIVTVKSGFSFTNTKLIKK
ncbi:MAG TPA: T9SS type A sorting domain-containing protein [Bacteroides sp.]|nr:T9SS type A sorting domain-containing protein [Bacteroides sp.]